MYRAHRRCIGLYTHHPMHRSSGEYCYAKCNEASQPTCEILRKIYQVNIEVLTLVEYSEYGRIHWKPSNRIL